MIPFAKYRERPIEELGRAAIQAALTDAGVERQAVEEVFCGCAYGGPMIGQRILRNLGMTGIAITNVENACSSGSTALREAVAAIALGRAEVVLVIGLEKLSRFGGGTVPLEESDIEVGMGMAMPGVYAMRAQRYMHETGATARHLAQVAVKARANAANNPMAQFRNQTTVEEVLDSRMVADPLTLYMCCPTGDGAAAVVLAAAQRARQLGRRQVRVAASVLQSGLYKTGFRDMAFAELSDRTARKAYEQAGVGPQDVSVAEVHDAFTIAELMYYEALGFCGRGEGANLLERGETRIGGRIPVNPSGGLLGRGHPLGATGVAQVCEIVWQLCGEAGPRQVAGAKVGLTHCTGGGISGLDHGACSIHVFTR
jgi:benzoylsuccinyl-CoA thiolase BbsB subunit